MQSQRPFRATTDRARTATRGIALALVIGVCLPCRALGEERSLLELVATIALPDVGGRFDHFALDAAGGRLFVAALANNTLEEIDCERFQRLRSIRGLREPTGVLFAAGAGRIQVANAADGTVRTYDAATGTEATRIEALEDADNMRWDPVMRQVYIGYGDGGLAIADSACTRVVARIALPGHPESFQLEHKGNRIFVNVPDTHEIVVVDREQRRMVAHWPLRSLGGNFPMALDEDAHRLFVGTRNPPRLVILDSTNGRSVGSVDVAGDVDDLFHDARRHRVYMSCGAGFLDVIDCADPQAVRRQARVPTRAGARTSYYDPGRDLLFVAVPQRGAQEAEIRVYRPH